MVNRVGLALSMAAMLIGLGALVWILGTGAWSKDAILDRVETGVEK